MAYRTGFKELNEVEERKFLEALGMEKENLAAGMKRPPRWAGMPEFERPVDIWIRQYRKYAKSLDQNARASLHRTINRLFFSLKEGKFISEKYQRTHRETLRQQYIIPENMRNSDEAQLWLKLAGAYTQAVLKKNRAENLAEAVARFESDMPDEWLDLEKSRYSDPVQNRAFAKFVQALDDNWQLFIDSYRNEDHATVINNAPVAASLQSFLAGRLPDGTPLRRQHAAVYWPKPLSHYAVLPSARQLFEAKKHETEALKIFVSGAAGSEVATIYNYPRWLRLGIDGVDPRPRPPRWKPKPSD